MFVKCKENVVGEDFNNNIKENKLFVDLFSYKCSYQLEDWFNRCCNNIRNNINEYIPTRLKFLCLVSSKTSFLIYYPKPIINEESFNPYLKSLKFKQEDTIFSSVYETSSDYERNLLFLPGKSINGMCTQGEELILNAGPIFKSCDVDLSDQNWCGEKSLLSAINYMLPLELINSTFSIIFNNEYLNITNSNVNYYCCQKNFYISTANNEEEKFKNCNKCFLGSDIKSYISKPIDGFKTCLNSVFTVKYTFSYSEINNLSLQADIYLLNVSKFIDILNLQMSINFKQLFPYSLNQNKNDIFNGYLKLSSLLFNSTHEGIDLWKADDGQLCQIDQFFPIKFGMNAISGCLIKISNKEFKNCKNLRSRIINMQSKIFNAKYIGKTPFADANISDDWVHVDVQEIEPVFNMTSRPFECSKIPNHIFVQIFYQDIPSKPNSFRIIKANVNYSYTTFEVNCNMVDDCSDEANRHHFLTSQIIFTHFSSLKQQRVSRYEEQNFCYSDNLNLYLVGSYWLFFLLILGIIIVTNFLIIF